MGREARAKRAAIALGLPAPAGNPDPVRLTQRRARPDVSIVRFSDRAYNIDEQGTYRRVQKQLSIRKVS